MRTLESYHQIYLTLRQAAMDSSICGALWLMQICQPRVAVFQGVAATANTREEQEGAAVLEWAAQKSGRFGTKAGIEGRGGSIENVH